MKYNFKESILFENQDYVLINKPPFISTLEDRHDPDHILSLAKQWIPDAQVCHRLDKDTSGVLALAKNPEAYRHLSMQFENREVSKTYHAVVDGIHSFQEKSVEASILKLNDGTVKISKEGKQALTYFTTKDTYKAHTLLECHPITGRMHQIRIHLRLLKAPITGDEVYGGKPFFVSSVKRGFNLKKEAEETPLIKRMALHAFSLEFALLNHETVKIEAPYPKDFQALIKQLSENRR
ncbi:MAG: RNA pseudouridine synthase [Cytophagales bacterium]|nr:RNA pseudouridine synthase [Cytophagales bacterium]MCA6386971.1 RNA pseudouridine synthase [Cytophagales bacterium]MCA6392233.1 RNA pseudouridine synthase [Cytophagales bacterium]MCA6396421.1 RNA pseudouridine synthase [Cytophagales bacterium]MCA6398867.1 RNA pseudouridine synthase [Cytophagales bacterium]